MRFSFCRLLAEAVGLQDRLFYEFCLGLDVPEAELKARRAAWTPPTLDWAERGHPRLHMQHVQQADEGCDLDSLAQRPFTAKTPV